MPKPKPTAPPAPARKTLPVVTSMRHPEHHHRSQIGAEGDSPFTRKLDKVVKEIRAAAGDNQCGDCQHALLNEGGSGFCTKYDNYEDKGLRIYRADATACSNGFVSKSS